MAFLRRLENYSVHPSSAEDEEYRQGPQICQHENAQLHHLEEEDPRDQQSQQLKASNVDGAATAEDATIIDTMTSAMIYTVINTEMPEEYSSKAPPNTDTAHFYLTVRSSREFG